MLERRQKSLPSCKRLLTEDIRIREIDEFFINIECNGLRHRYSISRNIHYCSIL